MVESVEFIVEPLGMRISVPKETTILNALRRFGIGLPSICGGLGTCGKCVVTILEGLENLSPPTEPERRHLSQKAIREGRRLACQARLLGGVRVMIPPEELGGKPRLQVEGLEAKVELDPAVSEVLVKAPPPTIADVRSDYRRLLDAIPKGDASENPKPILEGLRPLPSRVRSYGWMVRLVLWRRERVLDILPPRSRRRLLGIAIDVGTTKLAAYLLDLRSGRTLAVASAINPQVAFGEDVITRISYAKDSKGLLRLQKAVLRGINDLIHECCLKANATSRDIYEIVLVGNTAMHHICLGLTPRTLGFAPYVPVVQEALDLPSKTLRLKANPSANVHVLPVIAGFVGPDAVADILATGLHEAEDPCMIFDIGTNTEVVLGSKDGMICCSCASGPAFEGAGIKFGMRAADGAIEAVEIEPRNLKVEYKVVGNGKPRGLCGSGVIDTIAGLLKAKAIDPTGRMRPEAEEGFPNFRRNDLGQREFLIAPAEETAIGADIVLTQGDVREIQLAKAAVLTGAEILLREASLDASEIKRVFLAGAFGAHVRPESALAIGMLPPFKMAIIQSVGNAAGTGAKLALLSLRLREKAKEVAEKCQYIELHAHPSFKEVYFRALAFPA
ncbi:MAG: ASKHA domain-containing protein [Candidatus Bathyarchaeia archaeon]